MSFERLYTTAFLQGIFTLALFGQSYAVQSTQYHCSQGELVTITDNHGAIVTRLEGESYYSHDLDCKWLIQAPEGRRIQVTVVSSDLQYAPSGGNCHGYDYVGVREEEPPNNHYHDYGIDDVNSFLWCGNENPRVFSSKDNDLYIEFQSTDRNIYDERGVVLEFTFFSNHTCPPGWVDDDTLDNSQHCYKLRTHKQSWQSAQTYCRLEHSNLVSFKDDREADFIAEFLESRDDLDYRENIWIGLNDIKDDGRYVWIDGIASSATYRWNKTPHKSNTYDNCVSILKYTGKWKEEYCSAASIKSLKENKFVCKTNKYGPTTLFDVPPDRTEKEGEGSDVPIIGIVVSVVVVVLVAVIAVLVCVVCARKRQRRRGRAGKREAISYADIPLRHDTRAETGLESADPDESRPHPSAPALPQSAPPSYEQALRSQAL